MADGGLAEKAPVFSLPQDELLTLNVAELPLLKDAAGPGVSFKPLFLDPEANIWVVYAVFAPGATLPPHLHTGTVHGYTLKGRWYYAEYPHQMQGPGSYLYEPACSIHTFAIPEDATEDTHVLFFISGANVGFTLEGQFHSVLDALTVAKLVEGWSQANGGAAVDYIRGGSAARTIAPVPAPSLRDVAAAE